MAIKDALIPEYDHEMATTRRLLERVPEGDFGWKPHEKSMSLGHLAAHVAFLPEWGRYTLERPMLDLDTVGQNAAPEVPQSTRALLTAFDGRVSACRALLAEAADAALLTPWTLKKAGQEIFTMPRVSVIRSFVVNHLIHHRGQLSVYLRLKNVSLPPIYGPTADEQWSA